MPIQQTYYLDTATLSSATGIFVDEGLTTMAPDGFYSDTLVTRQMLGGVLYPAQPCVGCYAPCDASFTSIGSEGIYEIDISTGTGVGAILLKLNDGSKPNGMRAIFNSQVYNKFSSPVDGVHQSTDPNGYTFIGLISEDCGMAGTTYPALPVYKMDQGSFVLQPLTQGLTVSAGDVSLSSTFQPQLMVVPKTSPTASILTLQIAGVCPPDTWSLVSECPALLPGYGTSNAVATMGETCDAEIVDENYFASLVNSPSINLYDYVFADQYGQYPVSDGFYLAYNEGVYFGIRVENGVVVDMSSCDGCLDWYICNNSEETRATAIRFSWIDCNGDTKNETLGVGECVCISTTLANYNTYFLPSVIWADFYIPTPLLGTDFSSTFNGCL